jgi:hypothetical protein
MANMIIWWIAISLELVLVIRAVRSALIKKYPFFFLYLSSVLLCDLLLYCAYKLKPATYPGLSHQSEVLNLILGYGIVLEIFRHVLSRYPGVERFARIAGLFVFALILCFAVLYPLMFPGTPRIHARYSFIERDFLSVQSIFLLGILGIIYYYGIEVGKNIRGMILGYGVWLGASVIMLGFGSYVGYSFNAIRIFVQPFAYLSSLVVWLDALWSYSPIQVSNPEIGGDADYESLASATREVIGDMRAHLGKVGRP